MNKKKKILGITSLLILSLIMTGCGKEIEVKNGSKVAVSTNKEKYTATEYYNKIKEDSISTLVDLIDKDLLDKKYKTTDEEKKKIEEQLEQIKTYYSQDENNYKKVLKQYFGTDSEKEVKKQLSLQYKRDLAVKDYIKSHLTDKEIKDYYNDNIFGEVKASHILITPDAKDDSADEVKEEAEKKAEEKAKDIIKQLKDGKDFAKLAKENSDDKATSSKGGDLGYFDLDDMTESFKNAVKELKVDEYTKEPVKTEYGYHIILKTGEKDKPALKDVKSKIKDELTEQKYNSGKAIYYESLKGFREENKIKWNDSTLKKAYENYINDLIENANSSN